MNFARDQPLGPFCDIDIASIDEYVWVLLVD